MYRTTQLHLRDLPHYTCSQLHYFQTGEGPCLADLHRWDLAKSAVRECGKPLTMSHIVDMRPLTKSEDRLQSLRNADDDAFNWLETTAATAFTQ